MVIFKDRSARRPYPLKSIIYEIDNDCPLDPGTWIRSGANGQEKDEGKDL